MRTSLKHLTATSDPFSIPWHQGHPLTATSERFLPPQAIQTWPSQSYRHKRAGLEMLHLPRKNPPAPKVLGRDRPDGTRKRLQVYLGGGIFRPKPPVFKKHCKKQYGRRLFVNAPVQNRQAKSEKTPCFSTF